MNRLKLLRKERSLYQREIAEELGIDQGNYSKYEHGTARIPINILIKLSHYYEVSIDYLLYLTDVKEPHKKRK